MISRADRATLVAQAQAAIAQGSQSFAMASRLFDRVTRERAWLLYAWCRRCDDIVDGQEMGGRMSTTTDPRGRFESAYRQTIAALDGRPGEEPAFRGLALLVDEVAMPRRLILDHLAGFEADSRGWRPQNVDDLLYYCYQVAGVVGCMMAVVMGVDPRDEDTLDRACDLGIAFQLANIARDIVEDAENGRCYIPADWLAATGLTDDKIGSTESASQRAALAARLVDIASAHEDAATIGAMRLRFRSRWAVLAAAGIYGAIGRAVVRLGCHAWDKRVRVPGGQKAILALRALCTSTFASPPPRLRTGLWTRPR
ncbi:phytoene/squalene synthase family protein [Sphingomonas crocodyli]|uniref:Phytoene/squalene synthase family protein n=1 Tax=Sphingomonas crocodyli TaxID=1979270 RepID=A0A437LYG0_9SPHN|nr:phytoene/squalene synthase family protein [Sphingomonas crocodyli]RVT90451.1 phytoene/squalene synthase family protein [Sphingomonas crocodyli]